MKKLFVITGPFGAGLSEVVEGLFLTRPDCTSVTPITARKMKDGEKDGVGFFFYDLEGWNTLKENGDLLEATELAGNDYGTSRRLVAEALSEGRHVILSLEPERAVQIKRNMPEAVCVYVEPSPTVLEERYREASRSRFEFTARMQLADEQRKLAADCDETVTNDNPGDAVAAICRLIDRYGD